MKRTFQNWGPAAAAAAASGGRGSMPEENI
jgi:hypothetical protein